MMFIDIHNILVRMKGKIPEKIRTLLIDVVDEREAPPDELTLLHFIADYIRCSEDDTHFNTHWLCTRRSIQDNAVRVAKERYEAWKEKELSTKAAREDIMADGPYSKV